MTGIPERMEDIVGFALQLEQDGLNMYRELARKSTDPFGKNAFEGLADDELEHLKLLHKIYKRSGFEAFADDELETVRLLQEVYSRSGIEEMEQIAAKEKVDLVRQRFKTIFQLADEKTRERTGSSLSDNEALRMAMDFEQQGCNCYEMAAQRARGKMEKTVFKHLMAMEEHHYELLKETFDYLNNTATWLETNKQWIFEEG
jgi:rubrerythrin